MISTQASHGPTTYEAYLASPELRRSVTTEPEAITYDVYMDNHRPPGCSSFCDEPEEPAVAARSGACAARAAREGAPAPTLLRTPRTRRRIWSSHHALRGRGALSARRRSAGATRTSPRSPCGGPAPRSTSLTSAASTGAPCLRSASTRRRGRLRITTVTLCPCNTRIQETPKLFLPEHRLGRMDRRRCRRSIRRVLHPRDLFPTNFFHRRFFGV